MNEEKLDENTNIISIMTEVNASIKMLMESDQWHTTLHDLNIALEQIIRDVEKVNKNIEENISAEKNNTAKIAAILEDSSNRKYHQIEHLKAIISTGLCLIFMVLIYIGYAVT